MPPKQKTPAPIDRPLSRAYLRKFSGWSTAYPPGLSDPTSLRLMENVMTRRDGSVAVRPGLRFLSYDTAPTESSPGFAFDNQLVGTHEAFFLDDGAKAYLFAVRENDDTVGFRVLRFDSDDSTTVRGIDDPGIDFEIPQGEAVLNFTSATTYVKYLQIDNKIFALSNAGEPMRLFTVGETKTARKLTSIERPNWDVLDKLTVVEPDAAWINDGVPTSTRTNKILNPSFEVNGMPYWTAQALTGLSRTLTGVAAQSGSYKGILSSLPTRTNLMPSPLHNVAVDGIVGWAMGSNTVSLTATSGSMKVGALDSATNGNFYVNSPEITNLEGDAEYSLAFDFTDYAGITDFGLLYRFYASNGAQIGSDVVTTTVQASLINGTRVVTSFPTPTGTVKMRVFPYAKIAAGAEHYFAIKDVLLAEEGEATTAFSGDSGTNYSWNGLANQSYSVYHPPVNVEAISSKMAALAHQTYTASAYFRAAATARDCTVKMYFYNASDTLLGTALSSGGGETNATGSWTRIDISEAAPAGTTKIAVGLMVEAVARNELQYVDAVLLEQAASTGSYFDGSFTNTATDHYAWSTGMAHVSESTLTVYATGTTIPAAETPAAETLISSTDTDNIYSFGFFYTFSNEVGESAASQVTVVRAQRPWVGWKWETPSATGEPSGTKTEDPTRTADQLVAIMPEDVFDAALAQGAISWSLYMLTWSDQDPLPVSGLLVDQRTLDSDSTYDSEGWGRATPQFSASSSAPLPKRDTRRNYSDPSKGGQGLVAADRMVVVYDPTAAAVIRWTSNEQGSYTDFTASKGGGFKTLTSGNLQIPACVKLWQNPQSVDTLTILCLGTDGRSTGYYMAPAQVASQSEATNIMGFEETTATPGTTSPYGCEVANNALYHPLDEELMKSTANNYNITHTSMTDQIRNRWARLRDKQNIVSCFHDNRLYFIVHNPTGTELENGCMGNELWVLDISKEGGGAWSRWTIQAHSLRKIEYGGRTYVSVVRPDGLYYLDPDYDRDDYIDYDAGWAITTRFIPWSLETNTQGANRAHDAWCHLQQANVVLGNFLGTLRYGIRGVDVHGQPVEISKLVRDSGSDTLGVTTWDLEDFLLIGRDLKEWFFFAESVLDDDEETVLHSTGQLCLVQYRYAPISVNVGYEYGSVETFEYGQAGNAADARTTDNGVPMPYVDTGRP